jgi:hypothetical protein
VVVSGESQECLRVDSSKLFRGSHCQYLRAKLLIARCKLKSNCAELLQSNIFRGKSNLTALHVGGDCLGGDVEWRDVVDLITIHFTPTLAATTEPHMVSTLFFN